MKRGAKICALSVVALVATALMAFVLTHVAIVSTASSATIPRRTSGMRGLATRALSASVQAAAARSNATSAIRNSVPLVHEDREMSSSGEDPTTSDSSDCGVDRSFAPQCLDVSPASYQLHRSVQAVGRITVGDVSCTGVLLGNMATAYFLTAAHCLPDEHMVQAAGIQLANCVGPQTFTESELYHMNRQLDFAILKLNTRGFNVAAHFGFLHLQSNGPEVDHAIYVPHYLADASKRIAIINHEGLIRIRPYVHTDDCDAQVPATRVSYQAHVPQPTPAGAPLISLGDYGVVGLHVCGSCMNSAVSSQAIVGDLEANGKLIEAFLVAA